LRTKRTSTLKMRLCVGQMRVTRLLLLASSMSRGGQERQQIVLVKPTDRLSDGLFATYPKLIASPKQVVIEIEISSLLQGCSVETLAGS
jgi:hypothetical protein